MDLKVWCCWLIFSGNAVVATSGQKCSGIFYFSDSVDLLNFDRQSGHKSQNLNADRINRETCKRELIAKASAMAYDNHTKYNPWQTIYKQKLHNWHLLRRPDLDPRHPVVLHQGHKSAMLLWG